MRSVKLLLLSLLSGVLLWLSWPPIGIAFLILVAFIPLFYISDILLEREGNFSFWNGLIYSFPAFFVWNAATVWWIGYSTIPGAVAAILLNAFLMTVVFAGWHFFRKRGVTSQAAPLMFIAFWCSFEFLHLNWQIAWPWLNLGNVFANYTMIIQWYEFTGTFGGTIWILILNFLIYFTIKYLKTKLFRKYILTTSAVLIIPIFISIVILLSYPQNDNEEISVVIVQPDTRSDGEKRSFSNTELAQRMIETASSSGWNSEVKLWVAPESALTRNVSEDLLLENNIPTDNRHYHAYRILDSLIQCNLQLNIICGIASYKTFSHQERATMRDLGNGIFRECYNSAVWIDRNGIAGIYHKSKLVPGVELLPYPDFFAFLKNIIDEMGGFSFGVDTAQHTFKTTINQGVVIGTPICYESVFGDHFAGFVRNGAQLMAVITNDDWWGNSPGYKQHFAYAKLRAIETRRTILRAANSGISAFIDERGETIQQTEFREQIAIQGNVKPNDTITFYVKHGDYLAHIALALASLFVLFGLSLSWIKPKVLGRI